MKPLTPTTPHVIILVGIPGAGKSHFADHFAKTFHAPFVNHGALQNMTGISDAEATQLSTHMLEELLKTQRTLIYEGPTHQKAVRSALSRKLEKAGYKPLLVWVQTELGEAKRRSLKTDQNMNPSLFDTRIERFQAPTAAEKPVVISGKHTYASQVKMVLKHLAHVRPEHETPVVRPRTGRNILIR